MTQDGERPSLKLWTFKGPAAAYLLIAMVLFIASTLGAHTYASVQLEGLSWQAAVQEHISIEAGNPIGFTASLLPFLFAALLGAAFHRALGVTKALIVFGALVAAAVYFYFRGYWFHQVYLTQQLWTAAALTLGFSIMKAGALVLVACLTRNWVAHHLTKLRT